jgi:hypothetical protein
MNHASIPHRVEWQLIDPSNHNRLRVGVSIAEIGVKNPIPKERDRIASLARILLTGAGLSRADSKLR